MAETALRQDFTLAGFLAWEERQPERYERLGGVVRMMSGGTLAHDNIANNVRSMLQHALRGSGCTRFGPDVKVLTPDGDVFYPDALVRCGPADDKATSVDDPVVLVEVLSESTAAWDLLRKRLAYKTIPGLRVIVYVAQDMARVDLVRRDAAGRWDDDVPAEGLDAVLGLPEIGARLPLVDIYEGTEVAKPPAAAAG